jgi:uncharacterized protein (TIGR00369 family)
MIKLNNPYARRPDYHCFGCSPVHPSGLRMEFYEDGEELVCNWEASPDFQGFHDILHGGIQATMMDEIASWVVFTQLDTAGVTYRMSTRYRRPVHISRGTVTLRARMVKQQRNIVSIAVRLFDGEGTLCSEGTVEYFLIPRERAVREMHYPGKEAFYP